MKKLIEHVAAGLNATSWCKIDAVSLQTMLDLPAVPGRDEINDIAKRLLDATGLPCGMEAFMNSENGEVVWMFLLIGKDVRSYIAGRQELLKQFMSDHKASNLALQIVTLQENWERLYQTALIKLKESPAAFMMLADDTDIAAVTLANFLNKKGVATIAVKMDAGKDRIRYALVVGTSITLANAAVKIAQTGARQYPGLQPIITRLTN